MTEEKKEKVLADEILADARRQAERKLASARRTAERVAKSADSQARVIMDKAVKAAEETLERRTRMILADVPHQEQVRIIRIKEQVIDRLFSESLAALRSREGYDVMSVLVRLGSDAISCLPGDRFVLRAAPRDVAALGGELAERTAAEVRKTQNRDVTVDVVPSDDLQEGGVVVETADGGQIVDNSFATRMRRARGRLRRRIAERIFGEGSE